MKNIALILILAFASLYSTSTFAQQFTLLDTLGFHRLYDSSVDWGDFDNDGDLDVLVTGGEGSSKYTAVYRNDGANGFTEMTNTTLPGVEKGGAEWGDYNNDGYLDIMVYGSSSPTWIAELYMNNANYTFSKQTTIAFDYTYDADVDWGDYDNDGDLDIIISGNNLTIGPFTKLYKNNGNNSFSEVQGLNFEGLYNGSVEWGDYDNDGDLDILLMGMGLTHSTKIYRNEGNDVFTDKTNNQFVDMSLGQAKWGDLDNDGDLDIVISGRCVVGTNSVGASYIYINNGNSSFSQLVNTNLAGLQYSRCDLGDYNNDGYLDILLAGEITQYLPVTKIYTNNGNNTFTELISDTLIGVYHGDVKWGDYDNDGDLDILFSGRKLYAQGNSNYVRITAIYRNDIAITNTPPTVPQGLTYDATFDGLTFKWNKSTDNTTPSQAITYNISLGSSVGSINIKAPQSRIINGFHQIAARGHIVDTSYHFNSSWNIIMGSSISCQVQAIDQAKLASAFSLDTLLSVPLFIEAIGDTVKNTGDTIPISVTTNSNSLTTYSWSPGATLTDSTIQSPRAFSNKKAKYYVTVSSGGYTRMDSVEVGITSFEPKVIPSFPAIAAIITRFGDYDNDGDLDLLVYGQIANNYLTRVYNNDGNNNFSLQTTVYLPSLYYSTMDWVDLNNDGYLDILIFGRQGSTGTYCVSKLFKNNGNKTFTEVYTGFPGFMLGSFDYGDYDNDGDLDLIMLGQGNTGGITRLYRNDGNFVFSLQPVTFVVLHNGSVKWGDYDNDGDLDILIGGQAKAKIYRNDGNNVFTDQTNINLKKLSEVLFYWVDYNNDGYLDIFQMGSYPGQHTIIYKNNGPPSVSGASWSFTKQTSISLEFGNYADWGDYNNDGLIDLIICKGGENNVYKNNGNNSFSLVTDFDNSRGSGHGDIWADIDNDGDLDYFASNHPYLLAAPTVYSNNCEISNTQPTVPTGLSSYSSGNKIVLRWNSSSDVNTPKKSLNYCVNIGTTPTNYNIKRAASDVNTGYLKKPFRAKSNDTTFTYNMPTAMQGDTIYWSVQAVDNGKLGSAFTPIDSANFCATSADLVFKEQAISCEGPHDLKIKLSNIGLTTIDSLTIGWDVNGISQPDFYWSTPMVQGDSITIILDTNFMANGAVLYNFNAYIKLINGDTVFSVVSDTTKINATYLANPDVNIIADTVYCWNHVVYLDAGPGYVSYSWSNGVISQMITLDSNMFVMGTNEYSVQVVDTNTCIGSDTVIFYVDPCTGINTPLLNKERLSIMPNPNNGVFKIIIQNLKEENYGIEIYNTLGKKVYQRQLNPNNYGKIDLSIDISTYPKGIYIVRLFSEAGSKTKTIVVE